MWLNFIDASIAARGYSSTVYANFLRIFQNKPIVVQPSQVMAFPLALGTSQLSPSEAYLEEVFSVEM